MGCTASALNHDQQQEWIRSQMQVADEVSKNARFMRIQQNISLAHWNHSVLKVGEITEKRATTGALLKIVSAQK